MDIYLAYRALNRSVLEVAKSLNPLSPVVVKKEEDYIRLRESTFVVSTETARFSKVVSAHDLSQYVNKFYKIQLNENVDNWLNILLSIDTEEDFNVIKGF